MAIRAGICIGVFCLFRVTLCRASEPSAPTIHIRTIRADSASSPIIRKIVSLPGIKLTDISRALDSLGFFSAALDTSSDSVIVHSGHRAEVKRLVILSSLPCAVDSVEKTAFPRAYDAAELRALADKTLYYFGCRGYPFASLSIDIKDTSAGAPDSALIVSFIVSENGRYAFSPSRLMGKTKTNPRVLFRDIAVKPGALFDLRKIEESKNNLLSRSYVASVEIGALKIEREGLPDTLAASGIAGGVGTPFQVTDKSGLGVDGAVAFQAGQPGASALTGLFTMSLMNLFHYGETGTIDYRGQTGYQRLDVSCGIPFLAGLSLFSTAGFGLEIKQDDYGYLHGELEVTTDLVPYWQWGMALNGHEATHYVDSVPFGGKFEGLDFVLSRSGRAYRAGEVSKEATFKLGSGLTQASGTQLTRWHVDLTVGEHMPITARQAVVGRMVFGAILSDARDTLQTVELYRTGGYKSVRGYLDDEFAFTAVLYGQAEYHYYFNYTGSIYFFTDFGAGRLNKSPDPTVSGAVEKMLGYGVGIQVPVKIGDAAIEWARNYKDTRSWGRIHISVRNEIAAGLPH